MSKPYELIKDNPNYDKKAIENLTTTSDLSESDYKNLILNNENNISNSSKKKELENAQYELENSKQKLLIQIDKLWYDVEEAYKILSIAQKSIIQAEENLRINRNTYRFGTTTMTELLDAELLCRQVHDNYSEAYSKLHTKIIEYKLMISD